jgi:hypothetical protein
MDETIMNATNENEQSAPATNDQLKATIEAQLSKVRNQAMLVGFQVALHSVVDKITKAKQQPGKRSMNDYKRLIKELEQFCVTGLSRKIDDDNDTKLMEVNDEGNTNEIN